MGPDAASGPSDGRAEVAALMRQGQHARRLEPSLLTSFFLGPRANQSSVYDALGSKEIDADLGRLQFGPFAEILLDCRKLDS